MQSKYFSDNYVSSINQIVRERDINPSVGVSLLNYNGTEDTINCIKNLLDSTELKIVIGVLENGSSSQEKELLKKELRVFDKIEQVSLYSSLGDFDLEVYKTKCENIILNLKSDLNFGFCTGNNFFAEIYDQIGLDNILILNNDAMVAQGSINELSNTLSSTPETGAVSPIIVEPNGDIWYAGGEYSKAGYTYVHSLESSTESYPTNVHSGCCVLFDIDVYQEVGGMYNPLFICLDEPELARRVLGQGYNILVEPKTRVVHTPHQTIESSGRKYIDYFFARNMFIYSSLFNPTAEHVKFQLNKFIEFAKPIFRSVGDNASARAETGTEVVFDYYFGRQGPGSLWEELNALSYTHPLWSPDSCWNSQISKMHQNKNYQ